MIFGLDPNALFWLKKSDLIPTPDIISCFPQEDFTVTKQTWKQSEGVKGAFCCFYFTSSRCSLMFLLHFKRTLMRAENIDHHGSRRDVEELENFKSSNKNHRTFKASVTADEVIGSADTSPLLWANVYGAFTTVGPMVTASFSSMRRAAASSVSWGLLLVK